MKLAQTSDRILQMHGGRLIEMTASMIRLIRREIKGLSHRIWIIVFAVALGVAATTAVHALAESIQVAIQQESRPMMAGDLVARSMHTFPEDFSKSNPRLSPRQLKP